MFCSILLLDVFIIVIHLRKPCENHLQTNYIFSLQMKLLCMNMISHISSKEEARRYLIAKDQIRCGKGDKDTKPYQFQYERGTFRGIA